MLADENIVYGYNSDNQTLYVKFYTDKPTDNIIIPAQFCDNGKYLDVTAIGDEAFHDNSNIKSVVIPSSVTKIGNIAFTGCSKLTSIIIPNSVVKIGFGAFSHCESLNGVKIPDKLATIENGTFACSSIKGVTIPDSVKNIEEGAFAYCHKLITVNWGQGITEIGDEAFCDCETLKFAVPGNNMKNPQGNFSIIIPNSVTKIGKNAFKGCTSIESAKVPKTTECEDAFDEKVCITRY